MRSAIAEVGSNDNRSPAGTIRDGVLHLQLEIHDGDWRPELAGPTLRILAFAEAGKPATNPGPLIRVKAGTVIDVSIRSAIAEDIVVYGLHDRAVEATPLHVPRNGTANAHFRAETVGTYYYWGTRGDALNVREGRDSQLTGGLIVDPPAEEPADRVFIIGLHVSAAGLFSWVINGRSWPDTERMTYRQGELVRWRWINATGHRHPIHLHGHYFRVTSAGDNAQDVSRASNGGTLAVTELMRAGETMALDWTPERTGNWLVHCHNLNHVVPENHIPLEQGWFDEYAKLSHEGHMSGLVLGLHVEELRDTAADVRKVQPREITLEVNERPGVQYENYNLKRPGLGYSMHGGPVTAPGPPIVLERSAPVAITIRNRIGWATSVHWHGVELESYYDGVPHFGGDSRARTPYIAPGESFVARFAPPRAGTFAYHSHFNDYVQLGTGLYGALIVLERGQRLDAALDHTFVVSRDGLDDEKDPVLVNGAVDLSAARWRAGVAHRVRVIGMTTGAISRVRLLRAGQPLAWRAIAKDGADLPATAATQRPADFMLAPGETYDFEIVPQPGELQLEVTLDQSARQRASARVIVS